MKRFLQRTVGIVTAALLLPFATAGQAVLAETTADTAVCHAYTGTNEEAQNYMRWAQTMQSFLTPCSDGTLMQVQADLQEGYYIAQYYSSDFQPLRAVRIAQELPLFGGFYAAGDAYYILTGQSQATDSSGHGRRTMIWRCSASPSTTRTGTASGAAGCTVRIPLSRSVPAAPV